jgi:hypothetical protein
MRGGIHMPSVFMYGYLLILQSYYLYPQLLDHLLLWLQTKISR